MLNNIINFDKLKSLNSSKLLAGISIIMLNLGSRYLVLDLSDSTQKLLKLSIVRRITLFCVFFLGTRDIQLSFILTAVFIVISGGLFNEKSQMCILPENLKGNKISEAEYKDAIIIVKKYESQKGNNISQHNDLAYSNIVQNNIVS